MANLTKKQKFLKDNPDATPYDLMMAGHITKEEYEESTKENKGATQSVNEFLQSKEKLKPEIKTQTVDEFIQSKPSQSVDEFLKGQKLKPTRTILHTNYPTLETYKAPKSGNVYLNDKKIGKTTWMDSSAAERWRKKDPSRYTIS